MKISDLVKTIEQDLDSRNLKNPKIRKNALRKIVSFIEDSNNYQKNGHLCLPNERNTFKREYMASAQKILNGAEKHVIKLIYDYYQPSTNQDAFTSSIIPIPIIKPTKDDEISDKTITLVENDLLFGKFYSVNDFTKESFIPLGPGLYCIKLRKDVILPKKYGKIGENGILYIGKASKSLFERLWEEELNHIRPATFFRSVGTVLGYLPIKGSLAPDSYNYKFNETNTQNIRKWMKQSLLVNFIEMDSKSLESIEKTLIRKYQPLLNIVHNPSASKELIAARAYCVKYARGVDNV